MAMLPRLRPRTFYDLVIEVAIVRPGPIQGGMIHPYLRRRNGEEAIDMPHPSLEPILQRTLGVPLFQEQVMQIAIVGAGYTGGEADQLRRDMAAWKRNGRLEAHRDRLAVGFRERGISQAFAERLYKQIQGFGEYGFPESHAASFALLVYASAWLKVHHPAAFAAALINSQPMGFYSVNTILQDAQRHGVRVEPVCVLKSAWDCTLEEGALRVGLRQVKGLGRRTAERIALARQTGPFRHLEDCVDRARLDRKEVRLLAEAGAFGTLVPHRREALWRAALPKKDELFRAAEWQDTVPVLPVPTRVEQLLLDYERTGLSVADHPMRLVRPGLPSYVRASADLLAVAHGTPVTVAGMVICRQRPQTASGVVFVTMEDEAGFLNLVFFAKVFEAYRHVVTTARMLMVEGTVERNVGRKGRAVDGAEPGKGKTTAPVVYVVARSARGLALKGARGQRTNIPHLSRDFH
jgi:error-prone DNA polymerase